jgi:Asp-tRNA(Asn)/Glu-tRNA(Gln) amidotransferase A subunit family amidase
MLTRRQLARNLAALGIGSVTFQRALAAQGTGNGAITAEMVAQAEWIAGITLNDAERKRLSTSITSYRNNWESLRKIPLENGVAPAMVFHPSLSHVPQRSMGSISMTLPGPMKKPSTEEDLAFASVVTLSHLIRQRRISSRELTQFYLARLKKYDPTLLCVISLTEEVAMKQAAQADEELARGHYRGPLHGIPWGAKDLIAYPGYPTTWGAAPYKTQTLNNKATVARKLEEAGAVMVAKLTLGALAMNDGWFGGQTKNPWNTKQGSSGSSAGSASATSAGLVGFAIGSETLGSIVSPCTSCGVTGLRPTFGRVSKAGCMALAWSMDKIGPIARTVEDCAYIFAAIQGLDPEDNTTVDRGFTYPCDRPLSSLKVGYVDSTVRKMDDREEIRVLRDLGVNLVPVKLPTQKASRIVNTILTAEAGASFDELTRKGIREGIGAWPSTFQEAQFIPAVEYLRASRVRSQLMAEMDTIMKDIDAIVAGNDLVLTNLTGHPQVVMPFNYQVQDGKTTPRSITFTGHLYGESELLTLCDAFQRRTNYHLRRPPL